MIGLSLGLSLSSMRGGGGTPAPGYSAEATAYFAAMSVQPDATRKGLIDALISGLKSDGVWAKLDCLYLLGAHDAQAARLNAKNPGTFTASAVNSPTFTVDRGYAGDGATSYLDTGFNPATAPTPQYALNSASFGVWSRADVMDTGIDIGNTSSVNGITCRSSTTTNLRGTVNTGSFNSYSTVTNSLGHHALSRTASNLIAGYKNGSPLTTGSNTSSGVGSSSFRLLAGYNTTTFSVRQLSAAHIGAGLNGTDMAALYSRLNTYLTAIGAN